MFQETDSKRGAWITGIRTSCIGTSFYIRCRLDKDQICSPMPSVIIPHESRLWQSLHYAWASYQIRKIAGCACAGNAGNVFPRRRFQRKPLVSDPDMHHGTCVTHVPWCMSGSLTCGNGENVPGIPGACAPGILRIWQEAHAALSPLRYRTTAVYQEYVITLT